MVKTHSIKESLTELSKNKKIYKRSALYDIAKLLIKADAYGLTDINLLI